MPHPLTRFAAATLSTLAVFAPSTFAGDPPREAAPWAVVGRAISQGRATGRYWLIDYSLRNTSNQPQTIKPEAVAMKLEGYVSNSKVSSHACPRRTTVTVSGSSGLSACADVIPSGDDSRRCRENAVLQVWPAEKGENPPEPIAKALTRIVTLDEQPTWTIAPGGILRARLRLEHDHFLYGPYDALLGPRDLEFKLGKSTIRDVLPLDREGKLPRMAQNPWPAAGDPPPDRLDNRVFVSAPHSLHLEAHIPGNQSYRYRDCPVRYSTRMRLRYWYLIAPGTEGDCKSRIVQYKDAPAWKILSDGDVEQMLTVTGRWTRVERIFRTESEATSVTLEFRLLGDVGEMWIDDVSLEPVDEDDDGP